PGVRVAKDHIARAGAAAEIANTRELAVQADRQGASKGVGDPIVFYIVDQELGPILAGTGVAQHYVGFAGLAAEIADAEELPVQADVAHEGHARKFLVADVVDFEAAGGVPQQHLASRVIVETAERDKLPIGSDLAKLRAGGARITSEAVDLIQTIRSPTQHHDGGGANPKSEGFHELEVRGRELGELITTKIFVIEWIAWRELAVARRGRAEKVGRAVGGPIRHFLCATVDRKKCRRRSRLIAVE